MTSTAENKKNNPVNPYDASLPEAGKMAIIVPLIIGAALVIGVFILWQTHAKKVRIAEMARVEEEVQRDLILAYREMRDLKPESALSITRAAERKMRIFGKTPDSDYQEMKVAVLLLEAEAEFMRDCGGTAPVVEEKFTRAMAMMTRSRGELWEYGVMGRARARIEQKKYEGAIEDLDLLLARNPSYGTGYYWRSQAKARMGDAEGAAEDKRRAQNLDSWPPLRDYMRDACVRERDVLR